MKVKWGSKNESVTFLITGEAEGRSDEKLFLSILEKQVCDREILRRVVRERISNAQTKMHAKCLEVNSLKSSMNTACRELNSLKESLEKKGFWSRIVRFFLSSGRFYSGI